MVSAVSGRWDLLLTASFRSREDLLGFLTERLGRLNGVLKSETLHVLREVKRDSYYWEAKPLSASSLPLEGGVELERDRADNDV